MIVYNFHKYFLNFGTEKFSRKKIKWDKNLGENDDILVKPVLNKLAGIF